MDKSRSFMTRKVLTVTGISKEEETIKFYISGEVTSYYIVFNKRSFIGAIVY